MQNIYDGSTILEKKYADILHSIVAKLLWVEKRGRSDIKTPILFLCTRVSKSTKEDKKKLRRVLKFIEHTIDDKRIMGADSLIQLCTCVDAAYGLHPDLKIHTAGCMIFGYRIVHYNYNRKK